jgi:hypothetical protein
MTAPRLLAAIAAALLLVSPSFAAETKTDTAKKDVKKESKKKDDKKAESKPDKFGGLKFRGIGPAMISGRVTDLAVDPRNEAVRYVTAASGNVWKTVNAGTTWTPIFDGQGSYSIGCIALDPKNPLTVWVGSGENNSQRSVSYGDGVYRSTRRRIVGEPGAQGLRAHREDPHRPARLESRVGRGAGSPVGAGGRPRPLRN